MRARVLPSFVLTASLAIPSYSVTAGVDMSTFESICNYTAQNDSDRVRKTLRTANVRLRFIYDKFQCNNSSLLRFAIEKGADDVGIFVVKKVSKKALVQPESDGQTVLQWAEANGKGAGAVAAAIKERIN